jgi:hypothetical protein
VKNQTKRLKTIELTLTPQQTALLWLANAVKCTFADGARQFPRATIANSVRKTVTQCMKGELDVVVDRTVRQAREEADMLYNLAISVNTKVLTSTPERDREFLFLAQYLRGITRINIGPHSEEEIRRTVLLFIDEVFRLDGAVSRVCIEDFGGQPILFKDSLERLKHQMDLARAALECFNILAGKLEFKELTEKSIRQTLEADIAIQHSVSQDLAHLQTLADFGDEAECRAAYSHLSSELQAWQNGQPPHNSC